MESDTGTVTTLVNGGARGDAPDEDGSSDIAGQDQLNFFPLMSTAHNATSE